MMNNNLINSKVKHCRIVTNHQICGKPTNYQAEIVYHLSYVSTGNRLFTSNTKISTLMCNGPSIGGIMSKLQSWGKQYGLLLKSGLAPSHLGTSPCTLVGHPAIVANKLRSVDAKVIFDDIMSIQYCTWINPTVGWKWKKY